MSRTRLMKTLSRHLAAAVAVASFATMPTFAQTPPREATRPDSAGQTAAPAAQGQPIKAPTVTVHIRPSLVKVNRRQPIAFRAFEMRDPSNGNAIAPTAMVTLANGKQMTAQTFYAELNTLERQFNAIGYSLRDPQRRIELQQFVIDEPALKRQIDNLRMANPKSASSAAPGAVTLTPQMLEALTKEHTREVHTDTQRLRALTGEPVPLSAKTVHSTEGFNYTLGKTSIFEAFTNGKVELTGESELTAVYGEANAGGALLGNSKNIFRATGQATAPKTGTMSAQVTVAVLGANVFNLNKNTTAPWSESDSFTKSFDWNTSATFTIGPIPVKVTVGAMGNAGLAYFVALRPVAAKLSLSPTATASVYAQAGVGLLFASAGVGANMTLIDSDLNLGGEIAILIENGKQVFSERFYACVDLHLLKGNVYVYVEVYMPWGSKEWQWTLWDWSGYDKTACLFDTTKKTNVYGPPLIKPTTTG